ncbi:MAG: hypothetical protein ACUVWV_02710 [Thermodesulfobacteriota bacterium]
MVIGIILVLAGVLIAIYPPLLSIIVALLLIFIGAFLIITSYRFKRLKRNIPNSYFDFFTRY